MNRRVHAYFSRENQRKWRLSSYQYPGRGSRHTGRPGSEASCRARGQACQRDAPVPQPRARLAWPLLAAQWTEGTPHYWRWLQTSGRNSPVLQVPGYFLQAHSRGFPVRVPSGGRDLARWSERWFALLRGPLTWPRTVHRRYLQNPCQTNNNNNGGGEILFVCHIGMNITMNM